MNYVDYVKYIDYACNLGYPPASAFFIRVGRGLPVSKDSTRSKAALAVHSIPAYAAWRGLQEVELGENSGNAIMHV